MSGTTLALLALAWIVSAPINYGATYAYYDREFPDLRGKPGRDRTIAIRGATMVIGGPLSLIPVAVMSDFFVHGLEFKMDGCAP